MKKIMLKRNFVGRFWVNDEYLETPDKEWEKAVPVNCIAVNGALKGYGNVVYYEPMLPEIKKLIETGILEVNVENLLEEAENIYRGAYYDGEQYICASYINKIAANSLVADLICDYQGSYMDVRTVYDDSCGHNGGHHKCLDYGIEASQVGEWCRHVLLLKNKYKELKEVWKINL